jgi:hypothetical protein
VSDDDHDLQSTADVDAALQAAKPKPHVSTAAVLRDTDQADVYSADQGALDDEGPAADHDLGPGHLYDQDPNPGNPVGTRGIESRPQDVLGRSGREIPGATSGRAERPDADLYDTEDATKD